MSFDFKELLKGSGAAFITNAGGFLLTYVLTLIITNSFGASVYGDYALFVYTVKIVTIFAIFGIDIMSLRYVSEFFSKSEWSKINDLTIRSYASLLILSALIAGGFWLFQSQISAFLKVPEFYVTLIGFTVIPFCFYKFHNQCFRGQKKILLFSSFEFAIIPLLCIITVGSVLLFGEEQTEKMYIPIFVYILIVVIMSVTAFLLWTSKRLKHTSEKSKISTKSITKDFFPTLRKGFPFLLARTSTHMAAWAMLFLLKYYETSAEVGIYEAALKVAQLTILPLSAINAIAAPKFSEFFGKNNTKGLEKTAQQSTLMSFGAALPVVLIILLFSEQIMGYFGEEFSRGILVLQLLAVGQLINAATGPVAQVLQMTENQVTHTIIAFSSMFISLVAGIYLVSEYGLVGTALTYLIFVVINNGTCFLWLNFKMGISTLPRLKF